MADLRERLAYITLLVVFIGAGIAFYGLILFNHAQAVQLKRLEDLSANQEQTIKDIKQVVDVLKSDNYRNTQFLECIISLHAEGIVPDGESCHPTPGDGSVSAPAPSTNQPMAPSNSQAPTAASTPAPTTQPTPKPQSVSSFVQSVLKRVGL